MRSTRLGPLLFSLLSIALGPTVAAQPAPIGTWTAYPSLQTIEALAASDEAIWAATTGGVFAYDVESGEIDRFTRVDGLAAVGASAIAWDAARGAAWAGYPDGSIDRIDAATGTVQNFFDITRAEQFSSRSVNRLRTAGDSLLVATSFGLVVFDAARGEVRDSYTRLGPLAAGTAVFDALFAPLPDQAGPRAGAPGLWLATEGGVVWAPRAANLREPASWTLDAASPEQTRALGLFEGRIWLGTTTSAFERAAQGGWIERYANNRAYTNFFAFDGRLFAQTPFRLRPVDAEVATVYGIEDHLRFSASVVGPDGSVWVGDRQKGLFAFPPLVGSGTVRFEAPARSVVPDGPVNNLSRALSLGPDGSLWVGHGSSDGRSGVSVLRPDGSWERFESDASGVPNVTFYDTFVDEEGRFYGGTYGRGLVEITDETGVTIYDESNSSLLNALTSDDYIEALDAVRDRDGALWVTNVLSGRPFHVLEDGVWTAFPAYPGLPNRSPRRLMADRFGYLWFTLDETQGGGMGAIDSRQTPSIATDDRLFVLPGAGSGGTGLPHPNVRALAEDPDGRLWIGTERGLAYILSPGSVFGSDPSLAQPVWARVPDGTSYFLRDLFIFDITIDPAGRKWLGSTAGAWLTNAAGDEVLQQFTPDNSPLFDEAVLSVAVDPATGTTYFATSRGLIAYASGSTAPVAAGGDLVVSPNPLRDAGATVVVRGLPGAEDGAGSLKVLTVDGQVIHEADTRGGTYVWQQPVDRRSGRPLSPGVYIVAASGDGGASYGKLAVVR